MEGAQICRKSFYIPRSTQCLEANGGFGLNPERWDRCHLAGYFELGTPHKLWYHYFCRWDLSKTLYRFQLLLLFDQFTRLNKFSLRHLYITYYLVKNIFKLFRDSISIISAAKVCSEISYIGFFFRTGLPGLQFSLTSSQYFYAKTDIWCLVSYLKIFTIEGKEF